MSQCDVESISPCRGPISRYDTFSVIFLSCINCKYFNGKTSVTLKSRLQAGGI